jgi:predicted permease
MWSLVENVTLLYRVIKAKAVPESSGDHDITSPENQMWSLCANASLPDCAITKAKAFPESFGHEVLLILATIALVSIASLFISEVSTRICPPQKQWRHVNSSTPVKHKVTF